VKKIIHIVGARPNFIKAAPLIKRMNDLDIINMVVHTGQHYDHNMSQQFFDELNIPKPDYNLGAGGGSHTTQTTNIMVGCERIFSEHKPNFVIVYGDINSCVAATLVASKMHLEGLPKIKIVHVESGLRSYDRNMPEEINRVLTDSVSDVLFVTCQDALENLKKEGINDGKCYLVGNTMIDSLVELSGKFDKSKILETLNLDKKSYVLITLHRPSNVDTKENLKKMMDSLSLISDKMNCVFPIHPRTKNNLSKFGLYKKYDNKKFKIINPLGYVDFMCLQKNSKLIITDSGGIQEESSFFNVPCLTMRENTERPITCTNGTNELVGLDIDKLVERISNVDLNKKSNIKLWDGKASNRIVKIMKGLLK
jgi:UDP-N-acetylglucosamine 2-epimerase (non-hydrolysing)